MDPWFSSMHAAKQMQEAGKSYSHGGVHAHVHALPKPGPGLGLARKIWASAVSALGPALD